MAAAAAVSAPSSVTGAGTAWYSPNNCEYYDGLQRAAGHTLNGYLGTYGGGSTEIGLKIGNAWGEGGAEEIIGGVGVISGSIASG